MIEVNFLSFFNRCETRYVYANNPLLAQDALRPARPVPSSRELELLFAADGLRRKGGSLLPEYTEEEFNEATFTFVKYYVQSRHYDELVEENQKLKYDLDQELEWRHRTDS